MKIAILSDSHDHYENLQKAIDYANKISCEYLLFAGDLVAPGNGTKILSSFKGSLHFIFGNNDGEEFGMTKQFAKHENLHIEGKWFEIELDGKKIFMNHFPRIAEIALESGLFDLVIYGHDHETKLVETEKGILLNPGSLHPYGIEKATFAIYDTELSKVEIISVKDINL